VATIAGVRHDTAGPTLLITDPPSGSRIRNQEFTVVSLHPGVTRQRVQDLWLGASLPKRLTKHRRQANSN
jgi:hypothetical protein